MFDLVEQFKIVGNVIANPNTDFVILINLMRTCKALFMHFAKSNIWGKFIPFTKDGDVNWYKSQYCSGLAWNKYHDEYFRLQWACDRNSLWHNEIYHVQKAIRNNQSDYYSDIIGYWLDADDILALSKWPNIKHFMKINRYFAFCKLSYNTHIINISVNKHFINIIINKKSVTIQEAIPILNKLFNFTDAEEFLNMFINKQNQLREK